MRDIVIITISAIIFGAIVYGQRLQDGMRRKGYRPGESAFSIFGAARSLATVDALKFALLVLVLLIFVAVFAVLDTLEVFPR